MDKKIHTRISKHKTVIEISQEQGCECFSIEEFKQSLRKVQNNGKI